MEKPMKCSRALALALLTATAGGCASTKMTSSWRLPETGPVQFQKERQKNSG